VYPYVVKERCRLSSCPWQAANLALKVDLFDHRADARGDLTGDFATEILPVVVVAHDHARWRAAMRTARRLPLVARALSSRSGAAGHGKAG
jgi:hypothetical protein